MMRKTHPFVLEFNEWHKATELCRRCAPESLHAQARQAYHQKRHLGLGTNHPHKSQLCRKVDKTLSLLFHNQQFAFGLWVLAMIGNWFSTAGLVYLVILASFIWPKLYQEKREQIDKILALIRQKLSDISKIVWAKLPESIKKKIE